MSTPPNVPWLRALAVDEPPVPGDLAERATARARAQLRARDDGWSFVDDVVLMARRFCMVGGAVAAGLALLTVVVDRSTVDTTVVAAVATVAADTDGNPLVSWWQGWEASASAGALMMSSDSSRWRSDNDLNNQDYSGLKGPNSEL